MGATGRVVVTGHTDADDKLMSAHPVLLGADRRCTEAGDSDEQAPDHSTWANPRPVTGPGAGPTGGLKAGHGSGTAAEDPVGTSGS